MIIKYMLGVFIIQSKLSYFYQFILYYSIQGFEYNQIYTMLGNQYLIIYQIWGKSSLYHYFTLIYKHASYIHHDSKKFTIYKDFTHFLAIGMGVCNPSLRKVGSVLEIQLVCNAFQFLYGLYNPEQMDTIEVAHSYLK